MLPGAKGMPDQVNPTNLAIWQTALTVSVPLLTPIAAAVAIEQHPWTARMTTNRLEHQLPINAVEETLDVEIENPIVAPAALASLAHGISCRFAGPVAAGISVEHRLQDRLQIATIVSGASGG
jgi:hypothetical protein